MKKRINAQKVMLPHSMAKLDFYKNYLNRYIPILRLAEFTSSINIFDVFCGTGIYENGAKGSPIIAFEAIKESMDSNIYKTQKQLTPVKLYINDLEHNKVKQVEEYLKDKTKDVCNLYCYQKDAVDFFNDIYKHIQNQTCQDRNLILIDPYGYKNIRKEYIWKLMSNKRNTEIILFVPISQIYRFTGKLLSDEDYDIGSLRDFIYSFFPDKKHPIYNKGLSDEKTLIEFIRQSLTFNDEFFAASYFIQRDNKNHYYALFFVTPSIYGLEKILEVKWKLNEKNGTGFEQPKEMKSLFESQEKEDAKRELYERLEKLISNYISKNQVVNNNQIYEFTLRNMYLKSHANQILRKLQSKGKIKVINNETKVNARKGAFYLSHDYYKAQHNKILISIK